MRKNRKILLFIALSFLISALFVVSAFAATAGSGYMKGLDGKETNIKWTMTAEGLLTFEIDASATDKVQSTVIPRRDPNDGSIGQWNQCMPTYAGATKVIVGDGITELNGLMALKTLKTVEFPTSLTTIGDMTFETDAALESIYVRGTAPVVGTFDLSYITKVGMFVFDGSAQKVNKMLLSPNLAGELPVEFIKNASKLTELEIPACVTILKNRSLSLVNGMKVLTILGMDTVIESDDVFKGSATYPAIKAKSGSKAAEFAKANGYTFIDLDTGETIKGTKPAVPESTGSSGGDSTGGNSTDSGTTSTPAVTDFKPEGATLWGHSTGKYQDTDIVNTWWAYYDDTKTLEFVSATTDYNETGSLANVDKEYKSWEEYKDDIEHIIVGDNIAKVTGSSFKDYTALKDVRLGNKVNQIDYAAFNGCTSLTTIWRNGSERIEGRADLTGIVRVAEAYKQTAIKEIVLPKGVSEIVGTLPISVKTIYATNITDSLIEYAKTNLHNVVSLTDPSVKYEYWEYIDPSLPFCGERCVFGFDEATGTLTVYGLGAMDDIVNYYGGGSKTQPWFSIRNNVKHIVIGDHITAIGKYNFCEFKNLETVQIPATDGFEILNAAFEKCSSLKSVYRSGTEPIEGTVDIRNVHTISPWTFAYDFLIANVIISPEVEKIGTSVFEENITFNLANVYGTPGSFAETYAAENGLTFYDISSNTPQPIACTMPETTVAETETEAPETTAAPESETEEADSGDDDLIDFISVTPNFILSPQEEGTGSTPIYVEAPEESGNALPKIIAVAAAFIIITAFVVIIVIKKKDR